MPCSCLLSCNEDLGRNGNRLASPLPEVFFTTRGIRMFALHFIKTCFKTGWATKAGRSGPILLSGSAGAERASAATIASLRRTFSELLLTRFKVKKNTLALSGFERHLPCSHTT
jgi:hypothetical protein